MAEYDYATGTGYPRLNSNWQDYPTTSTPVTAAKLNHIDQAVKDLKGLTFNIKDFDAEGDDSTDNTTAIEAAITAAPAGSILYFPDGIYKFSTLSAITKPLLFVGEGWMSTVGAAFGNAAWAGAHQGTVLRSTATSGNAIAGGSGSRIALRDLMLVGPGSGTSVGVRLASLRGSVFSNVRVANFSKCWDLDLCLDSTFLNIQAYGAITGIRLNNNSNQNVFVNPQVEHTSTDGIVIGDVSASSGNSVYGGLCQNISGTAAIRTDNGQLNCFDGLWFEAVTATHTVDFGANGIGHQLTNAYFASDVTDLVRTASDDSRIGPFYSVTASKAITIDANTDRVELVHVGGTTSGWPGTVTDNGASTIRAFPLRGSATWDPGSIADGAVATTTVGVTGAVKGDLAIAGHSQIDQTGAILTAIPWADNATVVLLNKTGGALDVASGTVTVQVWKR